RSRAAPVELAAAAAVRLAGDHVLAGAGTPGPEPDPLRRMGTPRRLSLQGPRPHRGAHGRALGPHDARGEGTDPAAHARALRIRPLRPQREQGAMRHASHSAASFLPAPRWSKFRMALKTRK